VIELVLLKALLGEGNPGLFISVDRPHRYMAHLLDMHRIDHDGLQFLNVMSRFSPSNGGSASKVDFFDGPGHIDELPKALKDWMATERGLDISKFQFAPGGGGVPQGLREPPVRQHGGDPGDRPSEIS